MNWIAPSEKDNANGTLEKHLWAAADQFHANSTSSAHVSALEIWQRLIQSRAGP